MENESHTAEFDGTSVWVHTATTSTSPFPKPERPRFLPALKDGVSARKYFYEFVGMGVRNALSPGWDARRIAYLVLFPDRTPIKIEVEEDGDFHIDDGYHRLAAAIVRGDAEIAFTLSGEPAGFDVHFRDRVPLDAVESLDETPAFRGP